MSMLLALLLHCRTVLSDEYLDFADDLLTVRFVWLVNLADMLTYRYC